MDPCTRETETPQNFGPTLQTWFCPRHITRSLSGLECLDGRNKSREGVSNCIFPTRIHNKYRFTPADTIVNAIDNVTTALPGSMPTPLHESSHQAIQSLQKILNQVRLSSQTDNRVPNLTESKSTNLPAHRSPRLLPKVTEPGLSCSPLDLGPCSRSVMTGVLDGGFFGGSGSPDGMIHGVELACCPVMQW